MKQTLLEAFNTDLSTSQMNLANVYQDLVSLLGKGGTDRGSVGKYDISYSNISGNKEAQHLFDLVTSKVKRWPSTIREANASETAGKSKQDSANNTRRRVLFIIAVMYPPVANALYKAAKSMMYKSARNYLANIIAFQHDLSKNISLFDDADRFASSVFGVLEAFTETAKGKNVEESYRSSETLNQYMNVIQADCEGYEQLIRDLIQACDVEVPSDEIIGKIKWILYAQDMFYHYIYGGDRLASNAYNKDTAIPLMVFRHISQSANKNKTLDDVLGPTGENDSEMRKTVGQAVVKDMKNLGQNTKQQNYLSNKTRFTGAGYYKIFSVDRLSQLGYSKEKKAQLNAIKVVLGNALAECGLLGGFSTAEQYASFAVKVEALFKSLADDINVALTARNNIVKMIYKVTDKLLEQTEDPDEAELYNQAKDIILKNVVYSGSSMLAGRMQNGQVVRSVRVASFVPAFSEESTNDRNKISDVAVAGTTMEKCFKYHDGQLTVQYSDDEGDVLVDTMGVQDIRDNYVNYIASKLIPIRVSNDYAWVAVKGIRAFSLLSGDEFDDTLDIAPSKMREADRISGAKLYSNTLIDPNDVARRTMNSPKITRYIGEYGFADMSGDVTASKDALFNRVEGRRKLVQYVNELCDKYQIYAAPGTAREDKGLKTKGRELSNRIWSILPVSDDDTTNYKIRFFPGDAAQDIYDLLDGVSSLNSGKRSIEFSKVGAIEPMLRKSVEQLAQQEGRFNDILKNAFTLSNNFTSAVQEYGRGVAASNPTLSGGDIAKELEAYAPKFVDLASGTIGVDAMLASYTNRGNDAVEKEVKRLSNVAMCIGKLRDNVNMRDVELVSTLNTIIVTSLDMYHNIARMNASTQDIFAPIINVLDERDVSNIGKIREAMSTRSLKGAEKDKEMAKVYEVAKKLKTLPLDDIYNSVNGLITGQIKGLGRMREHKLREQLIDAVTKSDISKDDIRVLYMQLATVMDGSVDQNFKDLRVLTIDGIRPYLQTFSVIRNAQKRLDDALTGADEEVQPESGVGADAYDEENDVEPLAGLNAMDPFNQGAIASHEYDVNRMDSVDAASRNNAEDSQTDEITTLANSYRDLGKYDEQLDSLRNEIVGYLEYFADKTGVTVPDTMSVDETVMEQVLDEIYEANSNSERPLVRSKQLDILDKKITMLQHYKSQANIGSKNLSRYVEDHPNLTYLYEALHYELITPDKLDRVVRYIDAAVSVLNSLYKSKTYSQTEDQRFAYTYNDETAIAQLIYILGSALSIPNTDSQDTIISYIENTAKIIERNSGNPLSMKVASYVLSELKKSSGGDQNKEFIASMVNVIDEIGRLLFHRLNDTESEYLGNHGKISVHNPAVSSFARSQLRERMTGVKENAKLDKDEAQARQSYIDKIQTEMDNNLELAKYSYTLSKAFDQFDRTLTDERVSPGQLDDRSMHSIVSDLSSVYLWRERAKSDFQRSLISAIIEDEDAGNPDYPTVSELVDAAENCKPFNEYNQMYSTTVYDSKAEKDFITDDVRGHAVTFNGDGKADSKNPAPMSRETMMSLATNGKDNSSFTDVKKLVLAARMAICNSMISMYGRIAEDGSIELNKKGNDLLEHAIQSLRELCQDLDTPIAAIITASSELGQRTARRAVMKKVYGSLENNDDLDLNTIGMVSNEPFAYPQMMSSDSDSDSTSPEDDWIRSVASLISAIPPELTDNEVRKAVHDVLESPMASKRVAASDRTGIIYDIVQRMMDLDTTVGLPVGFYGDDSTKRKETINNIFNMVMGIKLTSKHTRDVWAARAAQLVKNFQNAKEHGSSLVGLVDTAGKVYSPSYATQQRIAHLRMSPYYSIPVADPEELNRFIEKLTDAEYLKFSTNGRAVSLPYPGLNFDASTFHYLCSIAIRVMKVEKCETAEEAFDRAVMYYVTGVRASSNKNLVKEGEEIRKDNYIDQSAYKKVGNLLDAHVYGEMVSTNQGWFTAETYNAIVSVAYMADDCETGVKSCINRLIGNGDRDVRSTTLDDVKRNAVYPEKEEKTEIGIPPKAEEPKPVAPPKVEEPKPVAPPKVEKPKPAADAPKGKRIRDPKPVADGAKVEPAVKRKRGSGKPVVRQSSQTVSEQLPDDYEAPIEVWSDQANQTQSSSWGDEPTKAEPTKANESKDYMSELLSQFTNDVKDYAYVKTPKTKRPKKSKIDVSQLSANVLDGIGPNDLI